MAASQHHYVYTEDDDPPEDATHVSIDKSISVIPGDLFLEHPNIIELICHIGVKKIEADAFELCPRLKRLVMPGVEEVEWYAFCECEAVQYVECKKLEIIAPWAFSECKSLENIDLSSAKIVEKNAFDERTALTDVKFGKKLESIGEKAFGKTALKRITIPLKNGLFTSDDVFVGCEYLDQVCLIEEAIINETVDALLLDEWKNDMNGEIDSINQTLPRAYDGVYNDVNGEVEHEGEKTKAIREWIGSVQRKIIHSKVEHYRLLSLAAAALACVSPNEIIINSALSFLRLPDHVFEGEGGSSATTPALDRQMWENVVQMKQMLIETEIDNVAQLKQNILEQGREIVALKAQNGEKEDEIHQLKLRVAQLELQVAESGGAMAKSNVEGLARKRPRGS